jgi:hypothetical protein
MPNLNIPFTRTADIAGDDIVITDNADVTLYTVTVAANTAQVEINIDMNSEGIILDGNTPYKFVIPGGIIEDAITLQGNPGSTELFTTDPAATISTLVPNDDSVSAVTAWTLRFNFAGNAVLGTGDIRIYETVGDNLVQTIDVTTTSLQPDGVNFNISPLVVNRAHYVQFDAAILYDANTNINVDAVTDKTTWNFDTGTQQFTLTPLDNTYLDTGTTAVSIDYGEPFTIQTGDLRVYDVSGPTLLTTIDVTTLTPSGNTLPFNIPSNVDGTEYYIEADASIVKGDTNGLFSQAIGAGEWQFFGATQPLEVSSAPTGNGDYSNAAIPTDFSITYDRNVTMGSGNLYVYTTIGDTLIETINVTTGSIATDTLTFSVGAALADDTEYYILTDAGIVTNLGNPAPAISSKLFLDFRNFNFVIDTLFPADGATSTDNQPTLVLTMSQNIKAGTGNIHIYETAGDILVESFDVTTDVTFLTTTASFTPAADLNGLTDHYVLIDDGAIECVDDSVGWRGIADKTTWNFEPQNNLTFHITTHDTSTQMTIFVDVSEANQYQIDYDGLGFQTISNDASFDFTPSVSTVKVQTINSTHFRWNNCLNMSVVNCDATNLTSMENTFKTDGTGSALIPSSITVTNAETITTWENAFFDQQGVQGGNELVTVNIFANSTMSPTTARFMFSNQRALTNVNVDQTFAPGSALGMFDKCEGLSSLTGFLSNLDLSGATTTQQMFANTAFTTIPLFDTSTITNFGSMFNECSNLTTIPLFDTSAGTNFSSMFRECPSLASLPAINTSAGTSFGLMFLNCSSLVCLSTLDTTSNSSFPISSLFSGCTSLTAPTAGEQTSLATSPGLNYTNAGSCP